MNTYTLEQNVTIRRRVYIEAESEQEALDKAENGDWIDIEDEETDWDYWEVEDVELGFEEYKVNIEAIVRGTNQQIVEGWADEVKSDLEEFKHSYDEHEAEGVEVVITNIAKN